MNKFKLMNTQTKEEHLCDKVTIDGFDYYVNNDICDYFYDKTINRIIKSNGDVEGYEDYSEYFKGVIATNNSNIDIPQVVDEVEILAEKFIGCKYEDIEDSIDQIGYDSFKRGYNKSQETHPFSEEDMIEFHKWAFQQVRIKESDLTTKELLKLWKEQQPKIVYYNE